jgi:hypothetical protein
VLNFLVFDVIKRHYATMTNGYNLKTVNDLTKVSFDHYQEVVVAALIADVVSVVLLWPDSVDDLQKNNCQR